MLTHPMTLSLDDVTLQADVALAATLREFLQKAGVDDADGLLSDGTRAVNADLELAHRWRDAALSRNVAVELLGQTPALVADDLLVLAEKG